MQERYDVASKEAIESVRVFRRNVVRACERVSDKSYEQIVEEFAKILYIDFSNIADRHRMDIGLVMAMPYLYLGLDRVR